MERIARSQQEAVKDAAARWAARLTDMSCTEADRAAFEAWRAESVRHDIAYERALAASERLDRLAALGASSADPDADLLAPKNVARIWPEATPPADARRRGWRPHWIRMAAVLFAAAGLLAAVTIVSTASPVYATGVGERRTVVLKDGTRIELNTDSKVVVRFRNGVREVELVRGEALFHVASDARPFRVTTPEDTLSTDEAEMVVRLDPTHETAVLVRAGTVMAEGTGARPIRIADGHEAAIGSEGMTVHAVGPEEIDRVLAWRQGAIALNGQSLADAATEFNRYNTTKIVVADASIAGLSLGGYFEAHDVAGFVRAAGHTLPIQANAMPDGSIRLTRRPDQA